MRREAKGRRHRCCRPGYRGELCELYEALMRAELWDKRDCLNSDGRRLFERLASMLLEEHPEHRPAVRKARRRPCIDEVASLAATSFYACDPLERYLAARGARHPLELRYRPAWEAS